MSIPVFAAGPLQPEQNRKFDRTIVGMAVVLFLLVVVLFSGLANCSFFYLDDGAYVNENPHVMGGLTGKNIEWAWTNTKTGYWIPLTWMSLQLDATFSDSTIPPRAPGALPDAPPPLPNASVYHVDNVILHAIASVLLFFFLWRASLRSWVAFIATLFWAVHPLRVESVAWITERKDVLAAVFGFATMLLYVEWSRRKSGWLYLSFIIAFLLSLLSKPMFVSLPLLLLVVDWWPLGRLGDARELVQRIAEKWPLWVLAVASSWLTVITQRQVGATDVLKLSLVTRLGHSLASYVGYLTAHVRVWTLGLTYPYETNSAGEIIGSAAILVLITAVCVWQRKRRPWFIAGWAWYLVAMVPMIGIVQAGMQGSADRFTYLPAVGLFVMAAFGVEEVWQRWRFSRWVIGPVAGAILIFFCSFTVLQASFWKDTVTLIRHSLVFTGRNFKIHGALATAYLREGKNELAAEQYQKAVDLNPTFAPAWLTLGYVHLEMGQVDKAIVELQKSAQLNPMDEKARKFHGLALARGGFYVEAAHEFRAAVYLNPHDAEATRYLEMANKEVLRHQATQPAGMPHLHPQSRDERLR